MRRIVLDTNVVVSGFLWGGTPRKLLALARQSQIDLFTSLPLLNELEGTLARGKFAPKFEATRQSLPELVIGYASLAETVACEALPRPLAPDPDDDWVIATALAARADLIVTGDKPLLGVRSVGSIRIVGVAQVLELTGKA